MPAQDEQYSTNVSRCMERVRHALVSRVKHASEPFDYRDSTMTMNTITKIRSMGVENMLKMFKECCPQRTQEIIGRDPLTASDLLQIQPPTTAGQPPLLWGEFFGKDYIRQSLVWAKIRTKQTCRVYEEDQISAYTDYLSICTPTEPSLSRDDATQVGLYVGSGTSLYGLKTRWMVYEKEKARSNDGVHTTKKIGNHLRFALQTNYTMHLRGWMFCPIRAVLEAGLPFVGRLWNGSFQHSPLRIGRRQPLLLTHPILYASVQGRNDPPYSDTPLGAT